ncbi:DUF2306 domain-containing protein [Pelagibaculum spongiae]|uniref:DUF2306 domain-containing protein n=1 Tax=Pelagibaculum spongiae TaxID=2080658 RepID=A0A2V1GR95_9GAMM|nr:DUF2306 domain-containing protein [Pelagibaculum spongiae]PVZ66293.1 hypothetical protein DC094_16455 [Pelagibaculum spongiae]
MLIPPLVLFHLCVAILAIITGAVVLSKPKGTAVHKLLGRCWVVLMTTTAITSFWIQQNNELSWIHILATLILATTSCAFIAIRLKKVQWHQRLMKSAYGLSLLTGGLAALLPGRFLNEAILDWITRF